MGVFFCKKKWTSPSQNETKLNETFFCNLHTSYVIIIVREVVNRCFFLHILLVL